MKTIDINQYLRDHAYPGRGILLGRSADNKSAVIAYFIMGRSANSRNRVFTPVAEDKGIMTEAFDPSKMEDPTRDLAAISQTPARIAKVEKPIP